MVHMKPGCCPGMRRGPRLTDEGHGLPCRSAGQGAFHATTTQVPFQPVAPRRPVKRGDQCVAFGMRTKTVALQLQCARPPQQLHHQGREFRLRTVGRSSRWRWPARAAASSAGPFLPL